MGRVKHYSRQHNKQHTLKRKKNSHKKDEVKHDDSHMSDHEDSKPTQQEAALSVGKKRQLFKKGQAKQIKAKIIELKQKSLKLKKKNLEQKAEKKKIAKEIHRLKAALKACQELPKEDLAGSEDESDDEMVAQPGN